MPSSIKKPSTPEKNLLLVEHNIVVISEKSDLDVGRVDEHGTLMLYQPLTPDNSGRKAVVGAEYAGEDSYMLTDGFRDVVAQDGFEGDRVEAVQSGSPPAAELLWPGADPDILKELEQEGDRERYVIRRYSVFGGPNQELIDYAENSDAFVTVNPDGLDDLTNYKGQTHDFLHSEDVPFLPSIEVNEAVDKGEAYTLKQIGETGRGYVIKSQTSSKGRHQYRAGDWDEVIDVFEENNLEEMRNNYILQPFIPHEEDHRWMTYGGEVRSGMIRRSDGTYQTNVSGDSVVEIDTLRALHEDRIAPLDPNQREDVEVAEAAVSALAGEFADPELERPNIITSADVMVADRGDIEGLPDSYLEDIDRHGGENAYLVAEFEPFPGKMIDHMHMWEGPRHRIPALQEAVFLEEMAGNEPGDPEEIAGDVGDRIWNRVRANFRSREHIAASRLRHDLNEIRRNRKEENETESALSAGPRP